MAVLHGVVPVPSPIVRPTVGGFSSSSSIPRELSFLSSVNSNFFRTNWGILLPPSSRTKRRWVRGAVIRAAKADYYSSLGVGKTATLQEIKSSYRKLARKVRDCSLFFKCCISTPSRIARKAWNF